MAIGAESNVRDWLPAEEAQIDVLPADRDGDPFAGFRLPGYEVPTAKPADRPGDQGVEKEKSFDLQLLPDQREKSMAVIDRAYGKGGTSGLRGKNPEVDPVKHLSELQKILGKEDLPLKIAQVIKEHKMRSLEQIATEASGSATVDNVFNQYKYLSTITAGIPRPDGKEMETGYLFGRQTAMAAREKDPSMSDQDFKALWMNSGIAFESGLYAQGMVEYLGRAQMNGPEQVVDSLFKQGLAAFGDLDESRSELVNALGDIPSQEVLDQKLSAAVRGQLRRSVLASDSDSSEKTLPLLRAMYGVSPAEAAEEIKKEMVRATGKDMDFKEIEDLIVKSRVESLKKQLGPIPIDK